MGMAPGELPLQLALRVDMVVRSGPANSLDQISEIRHG